MVKPNAREVKKITVSENRQITIPKRFYEKVGMSREVICEMHGDELILLPVSKEGSFSEEIIKELVAEGYNGQELLQEFRNRRAQIRPPLKN